MLLCSFLFWLGAPTGVAAQGLDFGTGDGPLEVVADESLEWRQDEQIYVALGNVVVRRGTGELRADQVIAHYRDTDPEAGEAQAAGASGTAGLGGDVQIYRVVAEGAVTISDGELVMTGAFADYRVDSGLLTMTGGDLVLRMPEQTITANERMIYDGGRGLAEAIGEAQLVRPDETVSADRLIGYFVDTPEGTQTLTVFDAIGDVEIVSGDDRAYADAVTYDLESELATLEGGVRLIRQGNIIVGSRAELNLATGVNRLLPATDGQGRVRALLTPGSAAD